jgi:hypothetical protein
MTRVGTPSTIAIERTRFSTPKSAREVSRFSDDRHIGYLEAAVTQSFPGVLIAICFALSSVAQPIAQEAATQQVDPRVPATHSRWNASSDSRGTHAIEAPPHRSDGPDLESSRLETSGDRELKPQMNQPQQGRRKRLGPLIPLMALGAIVLFAWLIAPRT